MRESGAHPGPRVLCVGLATLDLVHLVERLPGPDEKVTALRRTIAAGGPATNAAVTAVALGVDTHLVTAIGPSLFGRAVAEDLSRYGVPVTDCAAPGPGEPPVSTVSVVAGTGERSVVSVNGVLPLDLGAAEHWLGGGAQRGPGVVLVDGHYPELALAVLTAAAGLTAGARQGAEPVRVLDGGSRKRGTDALLAHIDIAVVSSDFHPIDVHPSDVHLSQKGPAQDSTSAVLAFLAEAGIRHTVITAGATPVTYAWAGRTGTVTAPAVEAVDTLGAGDVFHGAFVAALARSDVRRADLAGVDPVPLIVEAARVAALSVRSFGTREWIGQLSRS